MFYSFVDGTTPLAYEVKMFTGGGRTDPNICDKPNIFGEKVDAPTPYPKATAAGAAVTLNGGLLLQQCKKDVIDPIEVGMKKLGKDIDSFFNLGKKQKKKNKKKKDKKEGNS
mmetsp:Transcript_31744/g.53570  ORF Transcript_31744/g.53570 Transcript_31744/m.53570 type:complete len:112 (+) Transcript_31744:729-1064(+)